MGLPWRHAQKTLILTVCLGVWTQRTSAQAAEVTDARVGEPVTFTVAVTGTILTSSWYRGTVVTPPQLICTYSGLPSQVIGPQYTGRETCGTDGSLQIRDLRTNYTGNYTGNVQARGAAAVTEARQLRVYGTDPSPGSSPGLSAGAIVGIVIGVLAVIIVVCVLVYIFVIKKPASGAADARDSTEMASNSKDAASPKANGATAEIQYSSVNFVPKRATPAKPIAPENTVYSEVKR